MPIPRSVRLFQIRRRKGASTRLSPRLSSLLGLALALALTTSTPPTSASSTEETRRLHDWIDGQYEEELRFSPQQLTVLGQKALYDQLNDYSAEAVDRRIAWYESSVEKLREKFDYTALDDEGRTSYDFWIFRLERMRQSRRFMHLQYPMSQLQGVHASLPEFLINYHAVDTEQDMRDYNARLAAIDDRLGQVLSQVQAAAENGVRAPRFAYDEILRQFDSLLAGAPFEASAPPTATGNGAASDSPLWADARARVGELQAEGLIDEKAADTLLATTRALLIEEFGPAYRAARDWFAADRANSSDDPRGAVSLDDGKAYYQERLNYYTTTDLTAAEIHQMGLSEVARIHNEMHQIMEEVDFPGSLTEFFDYVRDDPRFYEAPTDEGRQAFIDATREYLDRVNRLLPEYFGILPKAPLEVRRVEAFREQDGAAAFYQQGTPDGRRPGVYYMHLSDMSSNNLTDVQTTAYHEGNPGHHMQVSIALERDDLPLFRSDVWYSGYGEGWALYAEQVAWEMGVYDDPYSNFGRLVSEVFRAIRLVVDTGIHDLGWSEEQAVTYMLENSAVPEGSARSEIQRYIVWPGQATSYKVGMLKILELREYARAMLGDGFDIRGFHDLVLAGGSLPLAILERRVHNWVRGQQNYRATLRRGPYGVAHIEAEDFGSLGYGEGFAAAEDHVCNIAYGLMQGRGETARYLGAGEDGTNIAFDAVVRGLGLEAQARTALASQSDEIKRWLAGFSAGYNRYLRKHSVAENASWCGGAAWVTPASPLDFMTRMVMVAQTVPRMSAAVAATHPPTGGEAMSQRRVPDLQLQASLAGAALDGLGSNGWALGRERTENGRGILLANPHYPWYGGNRFWEKHLTIPGKLDVYGAQLLGAPGVAIGFNQHLGWTHTVSASQRLVLYRLKLDPDDPMRYRHGDQWREIQRRSVSIPVLGEDGALYQQQHEIFFSHHGPLLTLPNMAWTKGTAFAVRDANVGNSSLLSQWKAMAEARDMDAFIDAHRRYNAMPWVNTMAASDDGRAVYLDNSTVGNLSEEAQAAWKQSLEEDPLAAGLFAERRMILLDGSDPSTDWIEDDDAPIVGTTPFDQRPMLERKDYIFNSNDSYWLTNPRAPMSDYSVLYGPVESARSLRTRMNLRLLDNHYGDAGKDGLFTRDEVKRALFANRGLTAELLLPDLLSACATAPSELDRACEVLARYDGTLNLDSPGAVLFREWITRYERRETVASGDLFAKAFDVNDPVETPRSLGDPERALRELEAAVAVLKLADLPLDARLGDIQFAWRGGDAIPVHGGNGFEGVANLQEAGNPGASPIAGVTPEGTGDSRYLTDAGYPIVHGSSFIFTLGFDDRGPVAEALLSYGQSGNPSAANFKDQTALYAAKTWRKVAFWKEDITSNTRSTRVLSSDDSL